MEKSYGILMNRKLISTGIYLFTPLYVIEGTTESYEDDSEEIVFKDSLMNYEYFTIENGEIAPDEEQLVGYIISEEELKKKFPNISIEQAKSLYFDEITEDIHIGFYKIDTDKIIVIKFDLNRLAIEINSNKNMEEMLNNSFYEELSEIVDKEFHGEGTITIGIKEIKRLNAIQDLNILKQEIGKLNDLIEEIKQIRVIDDSFILTIFYDSYNELLNITDVTEIKNIISNLENIYIDLSHQLEKIDNKEAKESYSFLCSIIEQYHQLQKYDDIETIKSELTKIIEKEEKRINKLADLYKKDEITEDKKEQDKKEQDKIKIDVRDMKKFFDKIIIGQEEAKKDIISAIIMNKLTDNSSSKNNCLLVGPTGSGKTLLVEAVSQYLNMPMEIIDTTQITVPGYVGASIEDFLSRLVIKAGSVEKAEQGIVVFDEIDKKGTSSNGDVNGKGVLNTLLPFIQGTTYDINVNNRILQFNTSRLTIFATGAFTDVALQTKEDNSNNIGFNSVISTSKEDIQYRKLEIEDFVKYGNMPIELIGRFSVITQLTGHTIESLKQILTLSNVSALLMEQQKLKKINIELRWTEEYLDCVARSAIKLKTGARSLKSIVEKSIKEARWEVLNNLEKYSAIVLTEKSVENNLDCELVDIDGNIYNLKDIVNEETKKLVKSRR